MIAPVDNARWLTIAIVSWNTRDLLSRCLDSLRPEVDRGVDVWVIDNASEDGSAAMVRDRFPWVNLIESSTNLGFGPAVNEVAQRVTTPWIAPANADIEVRQGALTVLRQSGDADPFAGVIAPRLIMPDGMTQHSVHCFPSIGSTLAMSLGVHRWSPRLADRLCLMGHWDESRRRRVDWAHGAFLLVRRTAFDDIGGFESERWMYAEDVDLSWRMARAGWATRYEPEAEVMHAVSAATTRAWGDERSVRAMAATYGWIETRLGRSRAVAIAAIQITSLGVRARAMGVVARVRGSAAAAAEARRLRWHLRLHRLGLTARQRA